MNVLNIPFSVYLEMVSFHNRMQLSDHSFSFCKVLPNVIFFPSVAVNVTSKYLYSEVRLITPPFIQKSSKSCPITIYWFLSIFTSILHCVYSSTNFLNIQVVTSLSPANMTRSSANSRLYMWSRSSYILVFTPFQRKAFFNYKQDIYTFSSCTCIPKVVVKCIRCVIKLRLFTCAFQHKCVRDSILII